MYLHIRNTIHLSILTTLAFALLGFTALFPHDPTSMSAPAEGTAEGSRPYFLQVIWYVVLALYGLSTVVAITTPLGPPLHFPVSRINTAESLDIGDLPIVPGSLRATYLFRRMRSALSTIRLRRFILWDIRPGSGWELAYRLAYINKSGFIVQMALASIGAVLYYAPPFCLQKLVKYLETDPERHDRSWGWFYSFAIFASTASLYISRIYPLLRDLGTDNKVC